MKLLARLALALCVAHGAALVAQPTLRESAMLVPEHYEQEEGHLGQAMVAADFDGDGFEDLAVGAPDYDFDVLTDAGMVAIYHGSPQGLRLRRILFGSSAGDRFGTALAAGDVQNRGYQDWLVIGAPGADITSTHLNGGAVFVYQYRNPGGWTYDGEWRQGLDFVLGGHRTEAGFGTTIISGDFNGDDRDDFAVGAPERDVTTPDRVVLSEAGSVNYFLSNASQPGSPRLSVYKTESDLSSGAIADQAGAHFGAALAAADLDRDGRDELIIGAPGADIFGHTDAGRVHVDHQIGSDQVLDYADVGGTIAAEQNFGAALAASDFDRSFLCFFFENCVPDVAIGIPGDNGDRGKVVVVYGVPNGGGGVNARLGGGLDPDLHADYLQHNVASLTSAEPGDRFGSVLHATEINGLIGRDLVIGTPQEDWSSTRDQGIVHVVLGGDSGLGSYTGVDLVAGPGTTVEPGAADDFLGSTLATGDFDGSGSIDLAVGIPGRMVIDEGSVIITRGIGVPVERPGSGAVLIFSDAIFADGFELGNLGAWSSASL